MSVLLISLLAIAGGVSMIEEPAPIEFRPHAGPQEQFLSSPADIAIYGGAAGGGKTYGILLDPLRHIHVPGYRHSILRRTSVEITKPGALWDESQKIYPYLGGVSKISPRTWTFPSGAIISFEYCEHESDLQGFQGSQIAGISFDEVTTFTAKQFWFITGRNRSTTGIRPFVRATCNPDPSSWVAEFIGWWIDQDTGFPIPERAGVIRFFARINNTVYWADTAQELIEEHGTDIQPQSVTFIPAKLSDNPTLITKDPGYRAKLQAMPEVERRKFLDGNWKHISGGIIRREQFQWFGDGVVCLRIGTSEYDNNHLKRFATIDTAGASEDRANEARGKSRSYSVVAVWDYHAHKNILFLRHLWRTRVEYNQLEPGVVTLLKTWNCRVAHLENATISVAIGAALKNDGVRVEFLPTKLPGQNTTGKAKYDRALAAGLLTRVENGWLALPENNPSWLSDYISEMCSWTGHPDEPADQIDVSSYAAYCCVRKTSRFDGVVTVPSGGRTLSTGSGLNIGMGGRR